MKVPHLKEAMLDGIAQRALAYDVAKSQTQLRAQS